MTHSHRNTLYNNSDGQRRCDIPELGCRTGARREEKDGVESRHLVLCTNCSQPVCQALQVERHQEQEDQYVLLLCTIFRYNSERDLQFTTQ